ncbi:HAMP domain-containing sensor histidine kinase [Ferrovibrio sp.]|uniref:sensor histidine kinase n=1 Tax=Ferrovibrio sp. TaxID=1917215 RepID=UPI0031204189
MTRLWRSTSVRLALAYALLLVVSSLTLLGLVWWNTVGYLDREIDAVIAADIRAIGDRLQDFGLAGAVQTVQERVDANSDKKAIYLLADPFLKPLAGNVDAWPLKIDRRLGWHEVALVYEGQMHATRLLHVALPGNFQLIVGRDVQDRAAMQAMVLRSGIWAAALALLLAVAGGLLVRRFVLRRIETINRTTAAIVAGDLGRRIPVRGAGDEFDQLAATINGMLEQIQQLIEGVRNVSNAIAHDLRTPLAELRARLEDILRRPPDRDLAFDSLGEAVADIDRLIGVFNALLRLAEIDSGLRRAGFGKVQLAPLAADLAELYEPAAAEKGVRLSLETMSGLDVSGDPFLLAQAVGNLLDNAVKYTPAGGHVRLASGRDEAGRPQITVADSGLGIPEAERGRVTERFYRGDAARGQGGVGLGLSLVQAVARLHGGSLALADNAPGLRAVLTLPAMPDSGTLDRNDRPGRMADA